MTDLPTGMEGRRIDRYVVEKRLGAGGFGTVFLARHTILGTEVALKVLSAKHAEQPEVVERFLREAKMAAAIGNPHIVGVYDAGVSEGLPFLAMELLRGEDLEQRITRKGVVPIELAIEIGMQVLKGLGAAHARGIVHRDMKPANVFLVETDTGVPFAKLLDFGVSKILDPGAQRLTQTGMTLGTPAYMAPEQLTNTRDVDHRADLYAVAVIIFEAISGHLPYPAETFADLMSRATGQASTRLDRHVPNAPREIVDVLAHGMEADPNDRFQSADDMLRALSSARVPGGFQSTRAADLGVAVTPAPFGGMTPSPAPYTPTPQSWASGLGAQSGGPMTGPMHGSAYGYAATPPPSYPGPTYAPVAPRRSTGMWIAIGVIAAVLPLGCLLAGAIAFGMMGNGEDDHAAAYDPPRAPSPQIDFPSFPTPRDISPVPPPPPPPPREPTVIPVPAGSDPCTIPVTHDVDCDRSPDIYAPATCTVARGTELHVLGSYSPGTADGVVRVDVMRTVAPVVLVLGAYSHTTWDIHVAEGARVERVITAGYERSDVTGLPNDVPVESRRGSIIGRGYPPGSFDWVGLHEMMSGRRLAEAAEEETGLSTRAFAGCYSPTRFVIGQRPP